MDKKNFLNNPIVTLGLVMSMTSLTNMTSTNDNILKYNNESMCYIQNTPNSMGRVKVSMLEESTEIRNPDLVSGYLSYNSNNEKYMIKNDEKKSISTGIIVTASDVLGEMRNLTKEESDAYLKGLAKISKPTGVSLF